MAAAPVVVVHALVQVWVQPRALQARSLPEPPAIRVPVPLAARWCCRRGHERWPAAVEAAATGCHRRRAAVMAWHAVV